MVKKVADYSGNKDQHIKTAAEALGRSEQRKRVFAAIYRGKKKIKTVKELSISTGLREKRVLEIGKRLVSDNLVIQRRVDGKVAYEKEDFYSSYKDRILKLAGNPDQIKKLVQSSPSSVNAQPIKIVVRQRDKDKVKLITIDDIDSFSKARSIKNFGSPSPLDEVVTKSFFKELLGEKGKFQDWGGENCDLSSTRMKIGGCRRSVAIAFKGKGTKGKLTPAKMGKNGDQVERLFQTGSDVFLVQYWGQIDNSILTLMKGWAVLESRRTENTVLYGVIDGTDTQRLIKAYNNIWRKVAAEYDK